MTKTLDTLVEDVYRLMKDKNSAKGVDTEAEIEKFGEAMKDLMRKEFSPVCLTTMDVQVYGCPP